MRANHGAPNAIVATAHTLARMVSHVRTYRQDDVEPGADDYEATYRDRTIRHLQRNARQLGLDLVPVTAQPSDGSHRRRCGPRCGMSRTGAIAASSFLHVRPKDAVAHLAAPLPWSVPRTTCSFAYVTAG
jgi:hypothetical protein